MALLPAAGNDPTSSTSSARTPRMWPSASSAKLTVIRSSRACWPAIRFSRRSSIHFTGRPRRLPASTTATSSGSMNIFCPKPPPTSCMTTRTRFSGSAERPRQEAADAVGALRRGVHDELVAEPVPDRHDAAALHRHAQVAVLVERLGDDVGGAGEDLRRARDRRRAGCAPATLSDRSGVHGSGAVGQRGVVADDGVDRVDLELDEVAGVLGDVARLGDDEHDRLAGEADVAVGHARGTAGSPSPPSKSTQASQRRRR